MHKLHPQQVKKKKSGSLMILIKNSPVNSNLQLGLRLIALTGLPASVMAPLHFPHNSQREVFSIRQTPHLPPLALRMMLKAFWSCTILLPAFRSLSSLSILNIFWYSRPYGLSISELLHRLFLLPGMSCLTNSHSFSGISWTVSSPERPFLTPRSHGSLSLLFYSCSHSSLCFPFTDLAQL